jgi:tetratricopeptide (TPR) repeat protein
MRRPGLVVLLLACFGGVIASGDIMASGDDAATEQLIQRLTSVDPRIRTQAEQALLAMGERARAPLRRAINSSDPAIASAAADILQRLPWTRPDDPPEVRELLATYGELAEEERAGVVAQLASLDSGPAIPSLLRIAMYEQSPAVAWQAAQTLRTAPAEGLRRVLADVREDEDAAPLLALRGWAVVRNEPRAALRWFVRCVEQIDAPTSGSADAEVRLVLRIAAGLAEDLGQRPLATDLRRRRVALSDENDADSALALAELLAGHVRVAADAELHRDLSEFSSRLHDPRVLYVLAESTERRGHGSIARGLRALADATMPMSPTTPLEVGDFLLEQGWDATARTLFLRIARSSGADDPLAACNAELRLSRIARAAKRHGESADHLERAFRNGPGGAFIRTDRLGRVEPWTDEQIELEIAWLRLADACDRNDPADIDRRLDTILPLASRASDVALEVLVLLHLRERHDDARRLFVDARAELEKSRQLKPDDPATLNNLAWLLARSGMAPEEALPLARRAVELAPDVAGYLDTLAEAQFRLGMVEDAIRTETRALELRPDDAFLKEQLERFRTTRPDRTPLPND